MIEQAKRHVAALLNFRDDQARADRMDRAGRPGRWYQLWRVHPPAGHALLQGRRSSTPRGFGTACARACSIGMKSLPNGSTKTTNFDRAAAPNSLKLQPRLRELVGRGYGS